MREVDEGLKIPDMARATTAPTKTPEKKVPDSLDPLQIPLMARGSTMPVPVRNNRSPRMVYPKLFQLPVSHNSENSIDVEVPSRDILSKMSFFDAPISSVFGPQLNRSKLTAMQSKITGMGFTSEQALAGLILTDANGIADAVDRILKLLTIPKHEFVERKSNIGDDVTGKHKILSFRPESVDNRWPWNVEDEKLCSSCGLPQKLFHKGDYDLNDILGVDKEKSKTHLDFYEEKHSAMCSLAVPESKHADEKESVTVVVTLETIITEPDTTNDSVEESITCGICFETLSRDKIFLAPCKHYYCKECLACHYRSKVNDGDVLRLPCLYLDENNVQCEREIEEDEILSLCDDETKAKYKKFKETRLIQLNENARHCPRPGCEGYVIGSRWKPKLTCGECGHVFCWKCTNDWHGYFTRCVQRHEGAFLAFTLGKDIQKCPKCKVRIWKSDGCNHMTCNYCKYEFCWLCRGKYSSNHFDDWNLFGCPGGQYFDSGRCPGFCPSYVNRILIWICVFGVVLPLGLTFISTLFALFLTGIGIWIACWAVICIPATVYYDDCEYLTPCGCRDECCD